MSGGGYFGDEQNAPARGSFTYSPLAGADLRSWESAIFRRDGESSDKWRVTSDEKRDSGVRCRVPGVRGGTRDSGAGLGIRDSGLAARGKSQPHEAPTVGVSLPAQLQ